MECWFCWPSRKRNAELLITVDASGVRRQCWLRSFKHFTTFYSLVIYGLHYLEGYLAAIQESSFDSWIGIIWVGDGLHTQNFATILFQTILWGPNADFFVLSVVGFFFFELFCFRGGVGVFIMSGGGIVESLPRVVYLGKSDYCWRSWVLGILLYSAQSFQTSSGFCYFVFSSHS